MRTTLSDIREPTGDFSTHKTMGSWTPMVLLLMKLPLCGLLSDLVWGAPERQRVSAIRPRAWIFDQAGGTMLAGGFPWAKPMLCLQGDVSPLPALFSCSPCFVLANLSCLRWSKGCSCPLGTRPLPLCPQNISFSISVLACVCRQWAEQGRVVFRMSCACSLPESCQLATAQLPRPPCKRDITPT